MNHASSIPGFEPIHQGKVRDTFPTIVPGALLLAATDRISTHDVVHKRPVPLKGQILTALSVFWSNKLCGGDLPSHLIATGRDIYDFLPDQPYPDDLHLRATVVKKLDMLPFELIFRRRMAGSLWSKYYSQGIPNPYGLDLPEGLAFMSPLEPAIFTPTDKSETDDPVRSRIIEMVYPRHVAAAWELYSRGIRFTRERGTGIEIIDTKLEVGIDQYGTVCIGDEILTPDSSRFVQSADIEIGKEPPWADKQIVRNEAERLWGGKKKGPPLTFSDEIIDRTTETYLRIFRQLTGMSLGEFQQDHL